MHIRDSILKYDSTAVKRITPDKAREEKVFSDEGLHYKKKNAKQIGWVGRFINWIIEKLFGKVDPDTTSRAIDIFIWILVIAGVGVIIWILSRTEFVSLLRGKPKETVFNFADVEEDIKGIDFNARIAAALQESNFRLAVRWYYLKQLNALNSKGLIQWQTYKTNIDYYRELKTQNHRARFKAISSIYDHVWYGEYVVSPEVFKQLENQFKEFENALNV